MRPERLLAVVVGATWLSGCLDREVSSERPIGVRPPKLSRLEQQMPVSDTDILLVVDDSISMGDKQNALRQSLNRLRGYFTRCIDVRSRKWVPTINGLCPPGMIADGGAQTLEGGIFSSDSTSIITTSVGAGGIACSDKDQGARLVPPATAEELAASDGDPFGPRLSHVGESGCGFEGPLEAMYRFLIDPEPPAHIATKMVDGQQVTVAEGIDTTILEQRQQVLHPLSQVVIVIVTDEDDCSVSDSGEAWKMGSQSGLARGSSACMEPANPCCRPCDTDEGSPPTGCGPLSQDPMCAQSRVWSSEDDPLNLRCSRQKQRFGRDWLFPIERYTQALTAPSIQTRSGQTLPNPLFAHGRTPDMVSVVVLSGVPWQSVVTTESLQKPNVMQFLTSDELENHGVWSNILGDPHRYILPTDPHLVESVTPRPGLSSPDDAWDPINGHEVVPSISDELQSSCIFQLPEPRECAGVANCECPVGSSSRSPLCRASDGTYGSIQRYARATPPPRLMEFARAMGSRAHVGSVCPRQLDSMFSPGFGYSDILLQAYELSYGSTYDLSCFGPSLPMNAGGGLNCKLLELHLESVDCAALGRRTISGPFADALLGEAYIRDPSGTTVCEIPPFEGDARTPGTPAYVCANDLHPSLDTQGYCYVDPTIGIGQTAVVDACLPGNQRRIRVIPQSLPLPNTRTELICDYGDGKSR
jgi:hypothetical protein